MSVGLSTSTSNNNLSINHQQQHQQMACIKRPQHNMKLANVLNNMLQCGSLTDVTIYCDDGQVNAHKLVLAASSSYFRNLFSRVTNAFHYPIIVLREMHINDLKTIIQFIYHGEVNVPQNRVDSLMRCANYLEIDGMSSSANSLNAILASSSSTSSMSHHSLLTTSSSGPVSASSNSINHININTTLPLNSKLHAQYPPTTNINCNNKQTTTTTNRAHGSRSSSNNVNNSSSNSTHDNPTKPKHTCLVCQKTFTHGFTLKRHMKLHSQSRHPIVCEICSKNYSCKDSYLRHMKSAAHSRNF